jgi:hypothetical protein
MWRKTVLCSLAALALATPASADPVVLSGSISVNTLEGPAFNLSGDGFRIFGVVGTPPSLNFSQVADFYIYCGAHNGPAGSCLPGQFIQLAGGTVGDAFLGNADVTVNGVSYSNAQFFMDGNFFADSVEVPQPPDNRFPSITLSSPFTFFGQLRATTAEGTELISTEASGSGTAKAFLVWSGDSEFGYFDEHDDIGYLLLRPRRADAGAGEPAAARDGSRLAGTETASAWSAACWSLRGGGGDPAGGGHVDPPAQGRKRLRTQKKPAVSRQRAREILPAATYSPTQFPTQYHRR